MTAALDLRHDPEVVAMDRRRGHRFQPPADELARIPELYATEDTPTADKVVHLHYFAGGWDWHLVELDPATGLAFGRVSSPACPDGEWGYVDLPELAVATVNTVLVNARTRATIPFPVPIERDCWWTPTAVRDLA